MLGTSSTEVPPSDPARPPESFLPAPAAVPGLGGRPPARLRGDDGGLAHLGPPPPGLGGRGGRGPGEAGAGGRRDDPGRGSRRADGGGPGAARRGPGMTPLLV